MRFRHLSFQVQQLLRSNDMNIFSAFDNKLWTVSDTFSLFPQWPEIGVEDREGFQQLYSSLALLAFSPEEIGYLWSILAAILHLGNIEFRENDEDESACEPTALSFVHVEAAASLLGVSETTLVSALVTKTRTTHSEVIVSPVSSATASSARDALSRAVYGRLFDSLVAKINAAIRRTGTGGDSEDNPNDVIGILDVFGFENLNHNSFEQLCINFANEVLHQFFLTHLFKEEQAEYAREGINWTEVGVLCSFQIPNDSRRTELLTFLHLHFFLSLSHFNTLT